MDLLRLTLLSCMVTALFRDTQLGQVYCIACMHTKWPNSKIFGYLAVLLCEIEISKWGIPEKNNQQACKPRSYFSSKLCPAGLPLSILGQCLFFS